MSTKNEAVGAELRGDRAAAVIKRLLEVAEVVIAAFDGEVVIEAPSRNNAKCRAVVVDGQPVEILVQRRVADAGAEVEIAGICAEWPGYEYRVKRPWPRCV